MDKTASASEFVLYEGAADNAERRAVFSDEDRGVVELHRAALIREAFLAGKARPVFSITERRCTWPLDSKGRRQANGSTCEEVEAS